MRRTPRSEAEALRAVEFRVLGTRVHAVDRAQAVAWIDAWIQAGSSAHIATVNPEFVMRARGDTRFREVLERTRLNVPDGIGVVLAGRLRRLGVPERVTGIDLVWELARLAPRRGWRLMLVGGRPGVAGAAARELERGVPGLQTPEVLTGTPEPDGDAEARRALEHARPHLVLVAFGAPAQELWIQRNVAGRFSAAAIGVGGAFDAITGRVPRAPATLQAIGLEWAYRLWREPTRWRRMRVLPAFALLAAREAIAQRGQAPRP